MKICLTSTGELPPEELCLPFGEKEEERLASIRSRDRRRESLCALWALRQLIGEHPPAILRSPSGKPYFEDPSAPAFSLCHTGTWAAAVLGDGQSGEVGIDLERVRPYPRAKQVAERFFTQDQAREFSESGETPLSFFRLWTKKEAVAKMNGIGLLAKDQAAPAWTATYLLTSEKEVLLLTVCSEKAADGVSFHSVSEAFQQFQIEELR